MCHTLMSFGQNSAFTMLQFDFQDFLVADLNEWQILFSKALNPTLSKTIQMEN